MKRKSEFSMIQVVLIILLAVGIVSFIPFIGEAKDWIFSTGNAVSCRTSLWFGKASPDCLEEVKIFTDKVEVNGKKFLEKGPQGTQVMAKEALAKLMIKCLNKGGGFNSASFSVENWVEEEAVCLKCYQVIINDEDVGIISDFTSYLKDTKDKGLLSGKTYLEELTKDPKDDPVYIKAYMDYGERLQLAPAKGTFEFRPFKKYTVIYLGLKKGSFSRYSDKVKGLWYAITLNFVESFKSFFGNQDNYFTYIADSNYVYKVCDRTVN